MKFKFTIGRRIGLGFAVLIIFTLFAFALTTSTIKQSKEINDRITTIYTPSVNALRELDGMIINSKMLIYNWVNTQSESEDKPRLKRLIYDEYPMLKEKILQLSKDWRKDYQDDINAIFALIDNLFENHHKYIMYKLNSFEAYDDLEVKFEMSSVLNEGEELNVKTRIILTQLENLITVQQKSAAEKIDEMDKSFSRLRNVVIILGIGLPVGGILIALFTVTSIIRPVNKLKLILLGMSKGVMPHEKIRERSDEIGEMSVALNQLVDSLNSTREFANEVGAGNFDSYYKPLSDQDELGHALLKMREELAINERELEKKVEERTAEVVQQKQEIELQKLKIEILFNHVTDSIRYAKRIQEAILPPDHIVQKYLPDSFVFYKPKDIVSGDFYWLEKIDNKVIIAAVDCTGHGVPGAFMSIVGYNQLKQAVEKVKELQPSKILDVLSKGVSETLHQNIDGSVAKDGMDVSLCVIDYENKILEFAGAFNPLYLIRDGELQEIKGNKFPVGIFMGKEGKNFTNHKISIQPNDMLYIFSDGYADQFGGPRGKKFMLNKFRQLLVDIHTKELRKQKHLLEEALEKWKGSEEQVDDILVLGIKI